MQKVEVLSSCPAKMRVAAGVELRNALYNRSQNWASALKTWNCPTDPASSEQACDICSTDWSGNWEHLHCRGAEAKYGEGSNGVKDGLVTTVHITDVNVDGPVPRQFCGMRSLREFDLDGGQLTGPFPRWFLEPSTDPTHEGQQCLPNVQELDFSFNRLTGTIPPEISVKANLQELKIEHNHLTGTLPDSLCTMRNLWRIRVEANHMTGRLPACLGNLTATLNELWIDSNDFEGDLYMLATTKLVHAQVHDNPRLCGMVPASVRWAHGFNSANTRLGYPC
ncbi:hypothetical protein V8C86DRAFT_463651 [Haematococcus lacustris]